MKNLILVSILSVAFGIVAAILLLPSIDAALHPTTRWTDMVVAVDDGRFLQFGLRSDHTVVWREHHADGARLTPVPFDLAPQEAQ